MHTLALNHTPHLDARLAAAANLVLSEGVVADIGCDHGKLTAYLACQGKHKKIIAADLRPGPLSVAQKTCQQAGCSDRVELRLGDGLQVLAPGEAQSIVLAGVSALTTIQILEQAPWIKTERVRLVLVPATKPEVLRQWLWEQGFSLLEEELAFAAGRWYAVIAAEYTGTPKQASLLECHLGLHGASKEAKGYRDALRGRLEKLSRGLQADPEKQQQVYQLLNQLAAMDK